MMMNMCACNMWRLVYTLRQHTLHVTMITYMLYVKAIFNTLTWWSMCILHVEATLHEEMMNMCMLYIWRLPCTLRWRNMCMLYAKAIFQHLHAEMYVFYVWRLLCKPRSWNVCLLLKGNFVDIKMLSHSARANPISKTPRKQPLAPSIP